MTKPTFVTGNKHKAEHVANLIGIDIDVADVEVDEIQSRDPAAVVAHKVKQAYSILGRPVFVDDFSFWFDDLDGLPGPFIKFFLSTTDSLEKLCRIADTLPTRRATARAYFGYYDGSELKILYGEAKGEVTDHPRPNAGHGIGTDFILQLTVMVAKLAPSLPMPSTMNSMQSFVHETR